MTPMRSMFLLGPTLEGCLYVLAFVVLVAAVVSVVESVRFRRLARERAGLSICQFARSFDCRRVDTKIIRAAYEGLQEWAAGGVRDFPVMAADDIGKLYGMVGEDLDEFAQELAQKSGRRWAGLEQNPLCGRVVTVRDLVLFVNHLPEAD